MAKSDLIDLLDDPSPSSSQPSNPANELADLFGGPAVDSPLPSNGSHNGSGTFSSNLVGLAPGYGGIMLPGSPQPQPQLSHSPDPQFPYQTPPYSPSPPAVSATPVLGGSTPRQTQTQTSAQLTDPFADLAGLF